MNNKYGEVLKRGKRSNVRGADTNVNKNKCRDLWHLWVVQWNRCAENIVNYWIVIWRLSGYKILLQLTGLKQQTIHFQVTYWTLQCVFFAVHQFSGAWRMNEMILCAAGWLWDPMIHMNRGHRVCSAFTLPLGVTNYQKITPGSSEMLYTGKPFWIMLFQGIYLWLWSHFVADDDVDGILFYLHCQNIARYVACLHLDLILNSQSLVSTQEAEPPVTSAVCNGDLEANQGEHVRPLLPVRSFWNDPAYDWSR